MTGQTNGLAQSLASSKPTGGSEEAWTVSTMRLTQAILTKWEAAF